MASPRMLGSCSFVRPKHHVALLLAGLAIILQLTAVLNPAVVEVDPEEMYNASHALELTRGHLTDALTLQYRSFCGGCTLDALLGAALFSVLPPIWLVWKLVPIGLTVALILAGVTALSRRQGIAAGWMLGALVVLPAFSFAALSLIAWGNHYESGVIAAGALLLVTGRLSGGRLVLLGALLIGGVWVGLSGLFALPAALVWLLTRLARGEARPTRLLWLLPGALLGALPLLLQHLSGHALLGEIYGGGEARPSLSHVPDQLLTLLHPRQLAGLLGAPGLPWLALPFAASLLVCAGLALRRGPATARAALLFVACWSGIYLLSGFNIPVPPSPQIPTPAALRYLVPIYPTLVILLASVCAEQRRHHPLRAGLLLAGPLLAGCCGRLVILSAPFPVLPAATMAASDHDYFRQQASYLLPITTHRGCTAEAAESRALHAYALGRAEAEVALSGNPVPENVLPAIRPPHGVAAGPFFEGAAVAAIDRLDPDQHGELSTLSRLQDIGWEDGGDGLRAALLARRHGSAGWLLAIEGHDEDSLRRLSGHLSDSPLSGPAWWLIGMRWGEDTGRWLIPSPLALPDIDPALGIPADFAEGLGESIGARLGPTADAPCPEGLPPEWESSFLAGYERGWRQRWGGSTRSPAGAGTAACAPPTSAMH